MDEFGNFCATILFFVSLFFCGWGLGVQGEEWVCEATYDVNDCTWTTLTYEQLDQLERIKNEAKHEGK